jgi:hypothetical protein
MMLTGSNPTPGRRGANRPNRRYSLYLLYQYKSINIDAEPAAATAAHTRTHATPLEAGGSSAGGATGGVAHGYLRARQERASAAAAAPVPPESAGGGASSSGRGVVAAFPDESARFGLKVGSRRPQIRMLAYADACKRMLTYADVCRWGRGG